MTLSYPGPSAFRWLPALALLLSLAACDATGPAGDAGSGDGVSYAVSGTATSTGGDGFGCSGSIWDPKRGRYEDLSLKVNLPKETVDAAEGARHSPQFELRDEADGNRLLLIVQCTLPNVQDPKVEKAHRKVGRFLAKEVRKLQRDLGKDRGEGDSQTAGPVLLGQPDAAQAVAPAEIGGAYRHRRVRGAT